MNLTYVTSCAFLRVTDLNILIKVKFYRHDIELSIIKLPKLEGTRTIVCQMESNSFQIANKSAKNLNFTAYKKTRLFIGKTNIRIATISRILHHTCV